MKDPTNRTKIVIRHLPPSLSQSALLEQIESRFSGRYNWCYFRPGKCSHKNPRYARAYINFNSPEDVFEFAEFFNGHVFVNEKGTQYKAIVEYSPSQRVPKLSTKKDGREGTIDKDPDYVEFLERISKPAENLPSADVQLQRKEAELAGIQEVPIVTPLMEYVRKKRAAKGGNQLSTFDGKNSGRSGITSPGKSRSTKLTSEKKKYILKASGRSTNRKEKSNYILVTRREDQLDTSSGKELLEGEPGGISTDTGKKKILLLKGKEQEISHVSDSMFQQKVGTSSVESSAAPGALKLTQRHDASGRIIRSILLNKETRQSQSLSPGQTGQKLSASNPEKSKRPPRPSGMRANASGHAFANEHSAVNSDLGGRRSVDDKSMGSEPHGFSGAREKQERRARNKERSDRGVWAPLRRSDTHHAGEEYASQQNQTLSNSHEGSHRQFSRRALTHSSKDEVSSKRGASGHGLHEKQVWVQKSASDS